MWIFPSFRRELAVPFFVPKNLVILAITVLLSEFATATPGVMDYYLRNYDNILVLNPGDHDGDGVPNEDDAFPRNPNEWVDTDGDLIGNNSDTDDDNDGMPDAFELLYNFNPLVDDSELDSDFDGLSNIDEYQLGTNPRNMLSCVGSSCILAPAPAPATITFPAIDTASDSVGAMGGSFSVSNTGGAEYTIPLYTPEGTAGVAPKLALKYRSDSGNGVLGKDWSLGALSVITRCAQTRIQDGQARGVNLSATDRFCLDGEKLVLVNPSDIYGGNGVEYRTEIDSFRKIISYTVNEARGPDYFRVWHKNGSVSEYGNTSDSRLVTINSPYKNVVWAQNRIEDANSYATAANNPVIYKYVPYNPAFPRMNNDIRIQSIEYAFANSTSSPNVVIEFAYEGPIKGAKYTTRQDGVLSHSQRMKGIAVKNRVGGALTTVRSYTLKYLSDNQPRNNNTSKLESIRECGTGGCYPITQFTWSDATTNYAVTSGAQVTGLSTFQFDPPEGQELQRYIPVDYNGDGKTDLMWLEPDGANFRFRGLPSQGSSFDSSSSTQSAASHAIKNWTVTDFDQDGYPDILFVVGSSLYIYKNILINGKRSYNSAAVQLISNLDMGTEPTLDGSWFDPKGVFADINGDGLVDVLYNKAIYYLEKDPSQTNGPYKFGAPHIVTLGDPSVAGTLNNKIKTLANVTNISYYKTVDLDSAQIGGDFNGDGLPDFVAKVWYLAPQAGSEPYDAFHVILLNDGSGGLQYFATPFRGAASAPDGDSSFYISDLNSDGLSDIVFSSSLQQYWDYALSTGVSLTKIDSAFMKTYSDWDSYIVPIGMYDTNQDGLPDFVYRVVIDGANDWVRSDLNNGYVPSPSSAMNFTSNVAGENLGNILLMDINGDGILDYIDLESKIWLGNKASGTAYNKIIKITNGMGEETNINYAPLTDPTVYTREFDAPSLNMGAPVLDLFLPAMVVSAVTTSAPIEGNDSYLRSMSYKYGGLKVQPSGRGFLGFRTSQITDNETGITVTNTFRQDFPFIGMPSSVKTSVNGQSAPLSEVTNSYSSLPHINGANVAPYLPVFAQAVSTQRVAESDPASISPALTLSGVLATTTTTASNYDAYGNAGSITTVIAGDGTTHTTTTTNTWSNDVTNWRLGQLTNFVESRQQGSSTITRTTSYTYNAQTGQLATVVREPQGGGALKLTTAYTYDTFGNIDKTTITGSGSSRYERVIYDVTGRYVDKTYNSLNQLISNVTQRNAYGQPETISGLNGKVQYLRYDGMGRQKFYATNEGLAATTLYRLCSEVSCPAGTTYRAQTIGTDGSLINIYSDKLGRERRKETKGFNGTLSVIDTWYDGAGRVKRQSAPYFSGAATYWSTNHYDNLGRLIRTVDANGGTSTTHFSRYMNGSTVGIQQLSKNQLNQSKIAITNGKGQMVRVVDNLSGYTDYTYDAAGNLKQTNSNGTVTSINYDILGRRTSLNDPDQGLWNYQYNAFGDMTQQVDAGGSKTTMVYDVLARLTQRKDMLANQTVESDARWTYGTTATSYNVGLLTMEEDLVSGYIKAYGYDNRGRVSQTVVSLGQDGEDGEYAEYFTYDQYGRPFQQIDATAHGTQYVYNAYGYKQKIVEATDTSHIYYTANQADAWGNVTSESLVGTQFQLARTYDVKTGLPTTTVATSSYSVPRTLLDIGTTFDSVGNLTARTRKVQAAGALPAKTLSEMFGYDQLNRLTSIAATGHTTQTQNYDIAGNILSKSGVGSYTYGAGNAGPHAVTAAGGATYTYDAVGNMIGGDGRLVTYNSFRKPVEISKGSYTTTFDYGPDRQHYKRVDVDGANTTITLSVGSVEFIREGTNSTATKRYIGGVMIVTDKPGSHEEHALLTDHLGSTVALAKANTVQLEQLDYDAFGRRRSLWTLNELLQSEFGPLNKLTTTGFTGHEMLDGVGLIHMNGRIYAPTLGRFMSADPYITEPGNTQNMNRYSYVYNNPMTHTDLSGFSVDRVRFVLPVVSWHFNSSTNDRHMQVGILYFGANEGANQLSASYQYYNDPNFPPIGQLYPPGSYYGSSQPDYMTGLVLGAAGLPWEGREIDISSLDPAAFLSWLNGHLRRGSTVVESILQQLSDNPVNVPRFIGVDDSAAIAAATAAIKAELDALVADGTLNDRRLFKSPDKAAAAVLSVIAEISFRNGLELGGNIVQDGEFWSYSIPSIGTPISVDVDGRIGAGYHTHTGYGLTFSNSQTTARGHGDVYWANDNKKDIYLGVYNEDSKHTLIGVCSPGSCANYGSSGTRPSRYIQL